MALLNWFCNENVKQTLRENQSVHRESPWSTFKKVYDCDLAGPVTVIERHSDAMRVQNIRQFPSDHAEAILRVFRELDHDNIVKALEFFEFGDVFYVLTDHYPLTLRHLVACPHFPTERELATILL